MKKGGRVKRDFLIGMLPGNSPMAGSESAEAGVGLLDVVLEDEERGDE